MRTVLAPRALVLPMLWQSIVGHSDLFGRKVFMGDLWRSMEIYGNCVKLGAPQHGIASD